MLAVTVFPKGNKEKRGSIMAATKTKWNKCNRLTVLFPVKLSCSLQQQQQNPPPSPPSPHLKKEIDLSNSQKRVSERCQYIEKLSRWRHNTRDVIVHCVMNEPFSQYGCIPRNSNSQRTLLQLCKWIETTTLRMYLEMCPQSLPSGQFDPLLGVSFKHQ